VNECCPSGFTQGLHALDNPWQETYVASSRGWRGATADLREAAPRSHAHLTQKLRIESITVSSEAESERVQVPASCSFGRWPARKI
jgi:hypothetical protein